MTSILIIFFIGLIFGLIPIFAKLNNKRLHTALAFSAGIFLGAVFLHILPAVFAEPPGIHIEHNENHILHESDNDSHEMEITEGQDHNQLFYITCTAGSLNLTEKGVSKTRRGAEQIAASALLEKLKKVGR